MKDINILVFGDSIAYGAWDDDKAGWVNRLRLILEDNSNQYYNIFNMSIPGETTRGIVERFVSECDYRYCMNTDTIIIFSIGINDSYIINGKNNISIIDFKNNILNLINMTKKYTKKILFIGLSNVDESKVKPVLWDENICYLNKEILRYNKVLEDICKQYEINYLNIFDLFELIDLKDGIHPNCVGHKKLCDEVLKKLNM